MQKETNTPLMGCSWQANLLCGEILQNFECFWRNGGQCYWEREQRKLPGWREFSVFQSGLVNSSVSICQNSLNYVVDPWTAGLNCWGPLICGFFQKYSAYIFILQICKLNLGKSLYLIRYHDMWNQKNHGWVMILSKLFQPSALGWIIY